MTKRQLGVNWCKHWMVRIVNLQEKSVLNMFKEGTLIAITSQTVHINHLVVTVKDFELLDSNILDTAKISTSVAQTDELCMSVLARYSSIVS